MAATWDITIRAGRDFWLPVSLITGLGNPANITGFQLKMTVKEAQGDADASALFAAPPVQENLAFGQFMFHITPADNSSWWVVPPGEDANGAPISDTMVYDVSCLDISQPPNLITLLEGSVGVIGPVTVAIP